MDARAPLPSVSGAKSSNSNFRAVRQAAGGTAPELDYGSRSATPHTPRRHLPLPDGILFLREFMGHPLQVASICPSSRFLERRVVRLAEVATARTVVELGAGTGGMTRAILRALPPESKLLTIEINPRFCALLGQIRDARLTVHCGCAQELEEAVHAYDLPAPDAVVSGIPFSTINRHTGLRIVELIAAGLVSGGRFVAYQVSRQVAELASPLLGPARMEFEFFNIPPMRLHRWDKQPAQL